MIPLQKMADANLSMNEMYVKMVSNIIISTSFLGYLSVFYLVVFPNIFGPGSIWQKTLQRNEWYRLYSKKYCIC